MFTDKTSRYCGKPFPQGAYQGFPSLASGDALGGGGDCRDGGDVGHVVLDGGFTDVEIVMGAQLARWGVDNQLNLTVFQRINDVRAAASSCSAGRDPPR